MGKKERIYGCVCVCVSARLSTFVHSCFDFIEMQMMSIDEQIIQVEIAPVAVIKILIRGCQLRQENL